MILKFISIIAGAFLIGAAILFLVEQSIELDSSCRDLGGVRVRSVNEWVCIKNDVLLRTTDK